MPPSANPTFMEPQITDPPPTGPDPAPVAPPEAPAPSAIGSDGQDADAADQHGSDESGADILLKRIKSEKAAAQHEARTAKQKATDAENRAATAEDQLKAAQGDLLTTQGDLARERVARKLGLPTDADLSMFTGATEEEVLASAEKVLAFAATLAKPAAPRPPAGQMQPGTGPQGPTEPTVADQIAAAEKAGDWAKAASLKAMQITQLAGKS